MGRKALVIGAQTGGLLGVHHDAQVMTTILTEREFDVDTRCALDATQAGVREGLARLVSNVRDDDAVVVYFSGHGNVARVRAPDGIELPERRFIVPTDYDESSPGDFRGVTAIELSVSVAKLTRRTPNVTVILDCCHAARMVRVGGLRSKAWPHPTYLDVAEHTGMLRAQGLETGLLHPIANPAVVRLMACGPAQLAYEYGIEPGVCAGVFTDALRVALHEADPARITWSVLMQSLRERVCALTGGQRPEAEGPSSRLLFDRKEIEGGVALRVVRTRPGHVRLPGAALFGVRPGDTFGLTPAGTPVATEETILAEATVVTSNGVAVEATVELRPGCPELPSLVEAHPLSTSAVRDPVVVTGTGALADAVRSAIDGGPTLRVAGADQAGPALAEVTVANGLTLRDGGRTPLAIESADLIGVSRLAASLRRMARTASLRRLAPGPGEALTDPFVVEWGRVVDRLPQVLPTSGASLHVGEHLYVRLRNESTRGLYFFVFDLGVSHRVTLVSPEPSGVLLGPGQETTIGERIDGEFLGSPLGWPDGLGTDGPRPETLLVLVTSEPQDLSALTHDGVRGGPRRSTLTRVLAAAGGGRRDWMPPRSEGFSVVHLDFELSPDLAPVPEAAPFQLDERPHPSMRGPQPRGGSSAPRAARTVAVRVTDLVVHRNRALWGADVRIDTVVLTGRGGRDLNELAKTTRFSRIRDGDRLTMNNLLIYHGPAVDYLDIAWWVSRDDRHGRALSELLRDRLTDETFQGAVSSLSVLTPQVGLALTAVSAVAIVVNTAYELLCDAAHRTIGLYRTSFLASEDFGIGRHPVRGSFTVQDFSFAYEIVDAS